MDEPKRGWLEGRLRQEAWNLMKIHDQLEQPQCSDEAAQLWEYAERQAEFVSALGNALTGLMLREYWRAATDD